MNKTINAINNEALSEMYFYETRVVGSIPEAGQDKSAQISSTTIEIFAVLNGESDKPVITFTADHNAPGSITVKVLRPINPQDFALLCQHHTHEFVVNEGQTMADEYQEEFAPYFAADVNENGLKVYAGDLIYVN